MWYTMVYQVFINLEVGDGAKHEEIQQWKAYNDVMFVLCHQSCESH